MSFRLRLRRSKRKTARKVNPRAFRAAKSYWWGFRAFLPPFGVPLDFFAQKRHFPISQSHRLSPFGSD